MKILWIIPWYPSRNVHLLWSPVFHGAHMVVVVSIYKFNNITIESRQIWLYTKCWTMNDCYTWIYHVFQPVKEFDLEIWSELSSVSPRWSIWWLFTESPPNDTQLSAPFVFSLRYSFYDSATYHIFTPWSVLIRFNNPCSHDGSSNKLKSNSLTKLFDVCEKFIILKDPLIITYPSGKKLICHIIENIRNNFD